MFCGNCFHDNALVAGLRRLGHNTLLLPLYLPMTLDEKDQSTGAPLFFSGINVYLEQKSSLFRKAPSWVHKIFNSPSLLKWASKAAGRTVPEDLGDLTISMLRGEEGNQARELDLLIDWLKKNEKPDLIVLSNSLLLGLARKLKKELQVPMVCLLQGEDYYLDHLPKASRNLAWQTAAERAREVDLFIAPSRYFADLMSQRLSLQPARVVVVHDGIRLQGYETPPQSERPGPPVLGFFARMSPEKGLDRLVESFIQLKAQEEFSLLKLKIGGSRGPADEVFIKAQEKKLAEHQLSADVTWFPNATRDEKIAFLKSLDLFSVPALYGEGFGLYLLEAWAAGVPVIQPRHGAFPELIEATGGGVLYDPSRAGALGEAIQELLRNRKKARDLGQAGQKAVREKFNADRMAVETARVYEGVLSKNVPTQ